MCGIAGKLYFDPERPVERDIPGLVANPLRRRQPQPSNWTPRLPAPRARAAEGDGVDEAVTLLGGRADVLDLNRAADLLVFPSRVERCPHVLQEAMASGPPVVATNLAGNRKAVGEGGNAGWLVPAENSTAPPEGGATMPRAHALRREVGAPAWERTPERFDIDRVGAKHLSWYEELL